jgi:hypothetical protein
MELFHQGHFVLQPRTDTLPGLDGLYVLRK